MNDRMISRRRAVGVLGALSLPLSGARSAWAQGRQPTMVIPYVPGGAADTFGRMFTDAFGNEINEKFVVENHGGAGGAIGIARVVQAPADGKTLLYTYGNLSLGLIHTLKDAPNILTDLVPVVRTIVTEGIIATGVNSRLKTFDDLLKEAAKEPGKISCADYGELTMSHLMRVAGIQLMRVPYKGGSPGVVDTITGVVDLYAGSANIVMPQIRSGKLRALAVTSPARIAEIPDIPTVREVLPAFRALNYQGLFAPKNTPSAVVERLYGQALSAIKKPEFQQRVVSRNAVVQPMGPDEFRKFMEQDAQDIAAVVKATASSR
ncbi:Bug family tripartite tricarboxylate transporter substrate binding protein [Ottowia thiooxydans]|uniref:Tripartite-type tricarboxylate transporter receptor subunit TctC n=1 Tax=Ottowia thiooxydans TaxID=219182 RepID=A0ABV2QHH9_9BURK